MILEAEGIAAKRQIEGYTYQQERGFDVAEGIAKNESGGNLANLGVGLGIMTGVGGTVGGLVNESIDNAVNSVNTVSALSGVKCPKCGSELPPNAKFCLGCGTKVEKISENEMICPHCGKQTPKGKFCIECGGKLQQHCPNCGNEVPQGAKFCSECGTKLKG